MIAKEEVVRLRRDWVNALFGYGWQNSAKFVVERSLHTPMKMLFGMNSRYVLFLMEEAP